MTQQPEKPPVIVDKVDIKREQLVSNFDKEDPRSFFNLLPTYLQGRYEEIPPELFELSEEEIRKQLFGNEQPDETTAKLRIGLWDEYDRVQRYKEPKISMERVCNGVCTHAYFIRKVVPNDARLVWMLHQTSDYNLSLAELHQISLRQMRSIMVLPITDPSGKPNTRLIEIQNKIFQHLDMRFKGAIIQRIDQRNINLTGQLTEEQTKAAIPPPREETMEDINRRLEAARQKSELLMAPSLVHADLAPISPQPERILNQSESLPIPAEIVHEPGQQAEDSPVNDRDAGGHRDGAG